MSKALRNDYLLLVLTGITLVVGLVGRFLNLEVLSLTAFIAGAAIGLALSISLLVAAIRHGEFGSDVLALISIIATALTSEWLAASVIALMLAGGRALESWAEGRARGQLEALLARAPHSAHQLTEAGEVRVALEEGVEVGFGVVAFRFGFLEPFGEAEGLGVFEFPHEAGGAGDVAAVFVAGEWSAVGVWPEGFEIVGDRSLERGAFLFAWVHLCSLLERWVRRVSRRVISSR